jgi:hypothetical protein
MRKNFNLKKIVAVIGDETGPLLQADRVQHLVFKVVETPGDIFNLLKDESPEIVSAVVQKVEADLRSKDAELGVREAEVSPDALKLAKTRVAKADSEDKYLTCDSYVPGRKRQLLIAAWEDEQFAAQEEHHRLLVAQPQVVRDREKFDYNAKRVATDVARVSQLIGLNEGVDTSTIDRFSDVGSCTKKIGPFKRKDKNPKLRALTLQCMSDVNAALDLCDKSLQIIDESGVTEQGTDERELEQAPHFTRRSESISQALTEAATSLNGLCNGKGASAQRKKAAACEILRVGVLAVLGNKQFDVDINALKGTKILTLAQSSKEALTAS